MSAALGLYRLQQVDGQIDQIQARQKWIQDKLQNDVSLRTASQACAAAEAKFKEASQRLKQSEADVEKQTTKIEQTEASLYGGSVRNPKELQDLQKEIVSLKKYLEVLEDRELEAMLTAETAQQEFQTAKSELEQTQIKVNAQNHDLTLESDSLIKDIERLQIERKAVIGDLASSAVEMYGQLRKQRRGLAVTTITDSTCAACGTTLTPAQQQNARSTSQLFSCPSCGRILFAN